MSKTRSISRSFAFGMAVGMKKDFLLWVLWAFCFWGGETFYAALCAVTAALLAVWLSLLSEDWESRVPPWKVESFVRPTGILGIAAGYALTGTGLTGLTWCTTGEDFEKALVVFFCLRTSLIAVLLRWSSELPPDYDIPQMSCPDLLYSRAVRIGLWLLVLLPKGRNPETILLFGGVCDLVTSNILAMIMRQRWGSFVRQSVTRNFIIVGSWSAFAAMLLCIADKPSAIHVLMIVVWLTIAAVVLNSLITRKSPQ